MSNRYHLTPQELDELEYEHLHTSDKRYADRLKAVCLLNRGRQVSQVAQALMIDLENVRNHYKRYRKAGRMALLRHDAGDSEQRQQLADYLHIHLYLTVKQVAHYVPSSRLVS